MLISVEGDGRKLEASGTVLLSPGGTIFAIGLDDIRFQFEFADGSINEGEPPQVEFLDWGAKSGRVLLYGYNSFLGVANVLKNVATVAQRQVTIGLSVKAIGARESFYRQINYSIFSASS